VLELGTMQKVADDPGVFGDGNAKSHIDCPHRGQSMGVRSDPARALHKMVSVPWIASHKYHLDTTEHLAGTPGVHDLAPCNLDFDAKVAFDSGNRINHISFSHVFTSQ
jgi:hypothetical protein